MSHQQKEDEKQEEEGPWLDLLVDLTENIIQRLPLPDYIRFAAVCRRWRSIHSHHRLGFSPSPPPILSLPWFISFDPSINNLTNALCISPFESLHHRRHLLSLPATSTTKSYTSSSPHGWLLMLDLESSSPSSFNFSLFNPISSTDIPLPPAHLPSFSFPPIISPPPNFTVFIINDAADLFFTRTGFTTWTQTHLPKRPCSSIPSNNLLCCISSNWDFFTVDPCSDVPTIQNIQMDKTQIEESNLSWEDAVLVESDGEVLMVVSVFRNEGGWLYAKKFSGYRVFKAELERKVWVKVVNLGERIIVMDGGSCVSLKVDGVGNGVKGNCIYFFEFCRSNGGGTSQWKVYDLGSGEVKNVENPSLYSHRMFVPSLC